MERFANVAVGLAPGPSRRTRTGDARIGRARGFTLQEASLAIIIVGIAFVASMELFGACTRENQHAARVTTAQFLAANIQEMTAALPLKDPFYAASNFGPEPGESPTPGKSAASPGGLKPRPHHPRESAARWRTREVRRCQGATA